MSTSVAEVETPVVDTVLVEAQAAVDALEPAVAPVEAVAEPAATAVTLDLKWPDGSEAQPAIVERTIADATAWGLSNEAGQRLLESRAKDAADLAAQQSALTEAWKPGGAEWAKRNDVWTTEAKADPDIIGADGTQFDRTVQTAQRALAKYGPELTQLLTETGMGSHPAAIKFLARIGRAMGEADFVPSGTTTGTARPKSDAQVLYPDHYDDQGRPKPVGS